MFPTHSDDIALTAVCLPLILPVAARAADPRLRLPAFDHLQRVATESVNISIGRGPLAMAVWVLNQEDPRNADAEDVDVCVSIDHDKVNGLAIVASSPRKFTIVNIVGSFDPAKLEDIEDRLGLTSLSL